MTLTTTRISSDWPCQVKTPGSYDWERSAAKWLRELVPARYASYPALIRHPVLLARHAQIQVQHEIRVARTALQTARADLPAPPRGLLPAVPPCPPRPPQARPTPAELLRALLDQTPPAGVWPPPNVARTIRSRTRDLADRRDRAAGTSLSMPSCLRLHAQALLDAGLTDGMVAEAVARGDR